MAVVLGGCGDGESTQQPAAVLQAVTLTPTGTLPPPEATAPIPSPSATAPQSTAAVVPPPASTTPTPAAGTPAPAAARFQPGDCIEVNTHSQSQLLVRKEATDFAPELRRAGNGTRSCIVDGPINRDGTNWYGLAEGGWAPEEYLQFPGEAPLPPRFVTGTQVEVNTHSLDRMIIRQQATLSAPESRRVENGTRLTIVDGPLERDGKTWWGFQEGGWAAEENLQLPGEEAYPAPTPVPTSPPAPPTPAPYRFRLGDYAIVTATPCLNLRDYPSTSAPKLTCSPPGTVLIVIGGPEYADGYEWWEVADGAYRLGWSAGSWLAPY